MTGVQTCALPICVSVCVREREGVFMCVCECNCVSDRKMKLLCECVFCGRSGEQICGAAAIGKQSSTLHSQTELI